MNKKSQKQKVKFFKCRKCGDAIYWNTHKLFVSCKCGAIAVDSCEDYIRLSGEEKDCQEVLKKMDTTNRIDKAKKKSASLKDLIDWGKDFAKTKKITPAQVLEND